jgi:hypothetical protein
MASDHNERRFHVSDVVDGRLPRPIRRLRLGMTAGLLDYPTVEDGARGMQFIEAVVTSSRSDGRWVNLGEDFSVSPAGGGQA